MDELEYEKLVTVEHSEKMHELDDLVIAMRAAGTPFADESIQALIDQAT